MERVEPHFCDAIVTFGTGDVDANSQCRGDGHGHLGAEALEREGVR